MNLIAIIHSLFVLYIVLVPFVASQPDILLLHVTLLTCLIVHWHLNNDTCALTLLEHYLFPETKKNDLFVQQLVGPVYNLKSRDVTVGTYALLALTLFRFVHTNQHFHVKSLYQTYINKTQLTSAPE
jgi:hypothetical protein